MILIFDTETTGLPDWRAPSIAEHQPHLVQLAFLLCGDDGAEVERCDVIVRPDGWVIPDEVAAIHGITTEIAMEKGIPLADALETFLRARRRADLRVAHNVSFDDRIMRIAMLRHGLAREEIVALEAGRKCCTVQATTLIVNLPPTDRMVAAGFNRPKPPKLIECIKHFFDEDLDGAHDALVDVRACARVFFHLVKTGSIFLPAKEVAAS
jgi:DNA polymerase-3 subunit epsilon